MMKKSIFTLILLTLMGYVSAQTLQFEWEGTVFDEGETIECTNDEYGFGEYIQHMQVRNITSEPMKVLIEKEIIQDLEGVINSFCWGMCFGPDTFVSPEAIDIPAGEVNTDELSFHALYPDDLYGDVIIKYYAYEERNPDQRISIIVRFRKSGVGVNENVHTMTLGQAYPNPATNTVSFNYSFGGNLCAVVYNLVGQEVMRQELNANDGQLSFSVADIQGGIYFCTMLVDGRAVSTQKFVVKK
ncbi:MAG: T9SS type A sorting domain-containing protein [Bacteroidales bacterium]|nr:T9SS type A sorting domain-containing protein [Bacteroidales bacterium]